MDPFLIAATVLDSDGNPIAGARVFFVGGPSPFPDVAALTDASGSVLLAATTPGTYEIQVVADGFLPKTEKVTGGEGQQSSLKIVLPRD